MSSNNYIPPFFFSQPPPNYNTNNSWNYNWPTAHNQHTRGVQDNRTPVAPPLPPGPPPPPPPPSNSRTTTSHSTVPTPNLEQRSQTYYNNSNTQGAYWPRRYSNNSSGLYNGNSQYGTSAASTAGSYSSEANQGSPTKGTSTIGQYGSNSRMYNMGGPSYGRNYYNKRRIMDSESDMKKTNKKKKKPLSQNVPQRKDWSVVDAKRALTVEKEYNKRHRSQSLIIKFPDLELNRDIVSKFHTSIDSVHFQQPSTPRFCFVTLKESADPEVVIKDLNKVPFGRGLLTAEYKKDREDEINIGPEDIDPLTLYVGNLAQEVTKEDMVNTYPRQKRIDIGYAKKMKYTRYAFVSFKNVSDSIEAFQKTHATQMYSKSLIVRFRRLNGTVGMPGEPKPQLPQRTESSESDNVPAPTSNSDHSTANHSDVETQNQSSDVEAESYTNSAAPWEMVDVSQWETDLERALEMSFVKQEPVDSDVEEEDRKPPRPRQFRSPFMPGDLDLAMAMHRPKPMVEVKKEKDWEDQLLSPASEEAVTARTPPTKPPTPKQTETASVAEKTNNNEDSVEFPIIPPDKIKKELDKVAMANTYQALLSMRPKPLSRDSIPMEVKTEPAPPVEAVNISAEDIGKEQPTPNSDYETEMEMERRLLGEDSGGSTAAIKTEPVDKDYDNDGDEDESDSSDDFNLTNILSTIEARSKRLKKIKKAMP